MADIEQVVEWLTADTICADGTPLPDNTRPLNTTCADLRQAAALLTSMAQELAGLHKLSPAQRAEVEAHIAGLTGDAETYNAPEHGWTCFHCGETFKTYAGARLHFGGDPRFIPVCQASVIKDIIRDRVQLEWKRDPGGGGAYGFIEMTLDAAARAIMGAGEARYETAEAELASERAHRLVAEQNLREAINECSGWAREAGEARGRLEMSEAAGIVDEWRERAEKAEAERDEAFRLADEAQHAWLDPKPWMERATVAEAELQQVKAERDEARARAEGNWIAGVGMAELAREALVQSDHFKRFMRLYAEAGHNEFMASLPLHDRALSVEAKLAEAVKGLEGLKVCLSEFVDAERRTAENSFCQYNRGKKVWNGKLWRAADPAGYAMVARARRAINGVASIRAPSSEGGEG